MESRRFQAAEPAWRASGSLVWLISPRFWYFSLHLPCLFFAFPDAAMPDALDLLTTRRSIKPIELTGPPPSADEVDTILTVASRVPDHGKLVPWRFLVFEGDGRLKAGEAIAAVFRADHPDAKPEHVEMERTRLARAPLVIGVVSRAGPHVKIPEWERVLSAGAGAMNVVLAAHALGP